MGVGLLHQMMVNNMLVALVQRTKKLLTLYYKAFNNGLILYSEVSLYVIFLFNVLSKFKLFFHWNSLAKSRSLSARMRSL